ncbi:26S proteasome non-ATPase regulatory subunit 5 protein [Dioscorea alata]|uniref:26S proteasome non-ATPase regulatory subunit 5 protein n=1 Tax=Dioscorea alata TaxID=55571 RepID=A0ACB7TVZ2_DIOAL|nr:26S proteasome non-ATPase regulatory subunit 5 protein [Dioscorea alata]
MAEAPTDLAPILEAASDFASYPGLQNDASAKEFLDRFPLPLLFSILQTKADVSRVEGTIVACLERLFKTKFGASLIPHYIAFVQAGLQAKSQAIQCLACKAVHYMLVNAEGEGNVKIILTSNTYPLLLNCFLEGDELTSAASLEAINSIAQTPEGIARIRILSLVSKLFSISSLAATAVYDSNLLSLFEDQINQQDDMLMTLSALELLYELVESPHSARFLLKTTLLQLLTGLISNASVDSIIRARAVMISGRLLSRADVYTTIDESRVAALILGINERLELVDDLDLNECESILEALGLIGTSQQGAALLLTSPSNVARHVIEAAFDQHGRGKQLAGLHALGNICGVERSADSVLLNDNAEEYLKRMIYATAAETPKLTPSGLFLSVLQQEPETRLAAYRAMSGLVARPWCLMEICSKQEIITIVTDASLETSKDGMDARYQCCVAINKALSASNMSPATGIIEKLQEAVRRGPYLTKTRVEPQPVVMTAERF